MARTDDLIAAAGRTVRRVVRGEQTFVSSRRSNEERFSFQRSVQGVDEAARPDWAIATGRE